MNHIDAKGIASNCRSIGLGALVIVASTGCSAVDQQSFPEQPSLPEQTQQAVSTQGVIDMGQGDAFACAILATNGSVKCWGDNTYGQLGQGNIVRLGDNPNEMGAFLPGVPIYPGVNKAIAVSRAHACVITSNNKVKCWGKNNFGQLGLGDTNNRGDNPGEMGDPNLPFVDLGPGRTAKAITAGLQHTCVILAGGADENKVACWGYNGHGELGIESTATRGDQPGEMGSQLALVNLGTGRTAKAIASGGLHVCAILDNNVVKCWGMNLSGQLGLGDTVSRGGAPGQMGDALPGIAWGPGGPSINAVQLVPGFDHTCVRVGLSGSMARVKCWGLNSQGQLGLGDTVNRGDNPGEMATLPDVPLGPYPVTYLASRGDHTCAISPSSDAGMASVPLLTCWGDNRLGQLGLGDVNDRGDNPSELPTAQVPHGLTGVSRVFGGRFSTCAMNASQEIKCWGRNDAGQLGQGDTNQRGDNPNEVAPMPIVLLQ